MSDITKEMIYSTVRCCERFLAEKYKSEPMDIFIILLSATASYLNFLINRAKNIMNESSDEEEKNTGREVIEKLQIALSYLDNFPNMDIQKMNQQEQEICH